MARIIPSSAESRPRTLLGRGGRLAPKGAIRHSKNVKGAMTNGGDPASFASKSDAELSELEKDRSLSTGEWKAVTEELRRRQREVAARPAPTTDSVAGNHPRIMRILVRLQSILVPGETLNAFAVQRRLFALTHRRMLVAATSGRYIVVSRGLFGGFTPRDIRWQDIADASVRVGIFGADITLSSHSSADLASAGIGASSVTVIGLRVNQAERVYRVCQAQEQAWREKRRMRDLDELRAKSGGIQLGASMNATLPANGDDNAVARLQRAKEMLDKQLISDSEYETIKAKIVGQL